MSTPSPLPFQGVALIGLGLMGGSLGLALRACGAASSVAGYDPAAGVAEAAIATGAVDRVAATLTECVAGADLVVLATPVLAMRARLREMAPALAAGALVTDLGSTKVEVMRWAAESLPAGTHFVGGHPMCGSERSGIAAASATLFRGTVWCLTPGTTASVEATERLAALAQRLGARPRVMEAARHDAAVARVSHLPLLAATALTLAAAQDANWPLARDLAAGGFTDTTRVASGSATMARDICLTNQAALAIALDDYIAALAALRARIAVGDGPALLAQFEQARATRDAWRHQHATRDQQPLRRPAEGDTIGVTR